MDFIKVGVAPDGYYKVELVAATRIYFEISQGKNHEETLEKLCLMIPRMIRLDGDLMQSFDDGGRTKPRDLDIVAVRAFAKNYGFRRVECALPGFDEM